MGVAIAGNTALGNGGGVAVSSGTGTIASSTITGNRALGAGDGVFARLAISCYIARPVVEIDDTIILGNGIGDADALALRDGAISRIGNSLTGGAEPSDVFAALDPATGGGLLADNGGPLPTVALLRDPANPALDAAGPGAPPTDARGQGRVDLVLVADDPPAADLGAFEVQNAAPLAAPDAVAVAVDEDDVVVTAAPGVLENDGDDDGDMLTVAAVDGAQDAVGAPVTGALGTLTLFEDGAYSYAADGADALEEGEVAEGRFTYTVRDAFGAEATAELVVSVTGAGDAGGPLIGTPGDDDLVGTPGDDVIRGLDGDDRIEGLGGDDVLEGGPSDRNTFVFRGLFGDDVIEDFDVNGSGREGTFDALEVEVGGETLSLSTRDEILAQIFLGSVDAL